MGKILIISWSLPAETNGSAVIIGNLAKQFTSEEMILAGEKPFRRPAINWSAAWPKRAYIALSWPPTWRGARWWRRLQLPLILMRSTYLAKKNHCSTIVAVFPNEEFLLVGYLTALWTGASLLPYFHNTYVENRHGFSLRFARWLQGHVFSRAEHVFVMSEAMVDLYRERYPKLSCSELVHSFNEDVPAFEPPPEPGSPLRLTICGNINRSCSDATIRICEAASQMEGVSLTLLTGTPHRELQELGLLRNGTRYETVSRDQVITRLKQADIVVLPHGFSGSCAVEEYRTMFPTKTIEYLICGRPILAHVPPNWYLAQFLRKHHCALIVDQPSIPLLIDGIMRLRTDSNLRARLIRNALRAATMFHAPRVAAGLRVRLRKTEHALSS